MKKKLYFSIFLLISCIYSGYAIRDTLQSHNIKFIENKNQWDSKALYGADIESGMLFLEKNCLTFNLVKSSDVRHSHSHNNYEKPVSTRNNTVHYHAYQVEFLNCNNAEVIPEEKSYDYCNYFIGNDSKKWASKALKYSIIDYKNLYNNIDFKIYSNKNFLKYDFIIKPNSKPEDIQLAYKYIDNIKISKGHL
ncbi:MAG: hypothetical protein NTZ33_02085, partial [Bacteroidetes bacterium]|nr:hypothetical protein [Bacteroidota bacterium]